ncbi:replication fork protection component Swi3-domain-containing protein [Lipomyces oligophaga]|uniref:replication fork protection component Swi3-domain-containing protein n=1 Tax=Lipomyces oligophaga TaxID=45792 RepID=UPI0034CE1779
MTSLLESSHGPFSVASLFPDDEDLDEFDDLEEEDRAVESNLDGPDQNLELSAPQRTISDSPLLADPMSIREVTNTDIEYPTNLENFAGQNDLGVDNEIVIKQRREIAKLDAERLLSPEGLSELKVMVRKMKFKGKGQELRDLQRLLNIYKIWSHKLFPKANFEDFLALVEKLGHTRPVRDMRHQFISEWTVTLQPPPTADLRAVDSDEESDIELEKEKNIFSYDDGTGFVDGDGDIIGPADETFEVGKAPGRSEIGVDDTATQQNDDFGLTES